MTDIQRYDDSDFDKQLNTQMRHAETLAQANMLPDKFKGNPANVLVAQEIARSMGESTWVTMTELYFVGNVPTFSAKYMRSRVRAAGHILRETFDPKTMTATCTIIRKDDPDFEHVTTWNKAKAQTHGLWDKGHWKKNPELMLKNRAVSEGVREACNEVLGGVVYTREEAEAMQTYQATATRQDTRGVEQVRAALAARKPAPEQAEPAEEAPQVTQAELLERIATAGPDDLDGLNQLAQANLDQAEYEPVRDALNARYFDLNQEDNQ